MIDEALLAEVTAQDAALTRSGIEIWIGAEPTFTNPRSQDPCWLGEALGGEKEAHAQALLRAFARRMTTGRDGVKLMRVRGRVYPGETVPRWCFGALHARRARASSLNPRVSNLNLSTASPLIVAPMPIPTTNEAWLTVTPDPGVVEVNMAPAHDLATFANWTAAVFAAAHDAALSPVRFRYNGDVSDSGGGGQLTLGGPSPARSPFFVWPQLLPGLVRYVNRHPALSYLFAPPFCGSASQGPRADESVRERFDELHVALDHLAARGDACAPSELWGMLAPLLVDASGCPHRAELNVEKLWNPWLAERGQLGLVEMRALRMPNTPARMIALAALFRALAARLAKFPYLEPLVDWGSQLHDACSLPWYLERDLDRVLADLEAHGFGLGPQLRAELFGQPEAIATVTHPFDGASLEIRSAVSFWPLLGDIAADGPRCARMVDSSAARVQLIVKAPRGVPIHELSAAGFRLPLRSIGFEQHHPCAIGSVVYRAFVPRAGLHPAIGANDPLVLEWTRGDRSLKLQLHGWRPHGGAYDGLPRTEVEARRRRTERLIVSECEASAVEPGRTNGLQLDLRRQHATVPEAQAQVLPLMASGSHDAA